MNAHLNNLEKNNKIIQYDILRMKKELEDIGDFFILLPNESLMCYGFECGDGWFDLIWELCEKIEKSENIDNIDKKAKQLLLGKDICVSQVKRKNLGY